MRLNLDPEKAEARSKQKIEFPNNPECHRVSNLPEPGALTGGVKEATVPGPHSLWQKGGGKEEASKDT